jgi:hypothetical protein
MAPLQLVGDGGATCGPEAFEVLGEFAPHVERAALLHCKARGRDNVDARANRVCI